MTTSTNHDGGASDRSSIDAPSSVHVRDVMWIALASTEAETSSTSLRAVQSGVLGALGKVDDAIEDGIERIRDPDKRYLHGFGVASTTTSTPIRSDTWTPKPSRCTGFRSTGGHAPLDIGDDALRPRQPGVPALRAARAARAGQRADYARLGGSPSHSRPRSP